MTTDFDRAVSLEPGLRAAVALVDTLCEFVQPDDQMCTGCVWETILKPLVSPLIGWSRGEKMKAREDDDSLRFDFTDLVEESIRAESIRGDNEKWLRSSEAWDAFTDELLKRLEKADPGNGHGIAKRS